MKTSKLKYVPALAVGILSLTATSQATLITSTAGLPPAGVYLSTDIHAIYSGPALDYLITLPMHAPIVAEIGKRSGGNGSPGGPNDEIESFGSTLDAMIEIKDRATGTTVVPNGPIHASGPFGSVQTIVFGYNLSPDGTGTFNTEMLALSLSGTYLGAPFMIRESPTKQSTGLTSVAPAPGGYQIDSFFDVFTELSLDGGLTWMPDTDSVATGQRVTLEAVPEPTSMSLLALGAASVAGFIRRRR